MQVKQAIKDVMQKKKVANVCIYSTCVHAKGGGGRGIGILKNWEKEAKRKYDNAMQCYPTWMKKKKKGKKVTEIQLCMKKKEEEI